MTMIGIVLVSYGYTILFLTTNKTAAIAVLLAHTVGVCIHLFFHLYTHTPGCTFDDFISLLE